MSNELILGLAENQYRLRPSSAALRSWVRCALMTCRLNNTITGRQVLLINHGFNTTSQLIILLNSQADAIVFLYRKTISFRGCDHFLIGLLQYFLASGFITCLFQLRLILLCHRGYFTRCIDVAL